MVEMRGRDVCVGRCRRAILSTTKGMIKDYPAFKPEGLEHLMAGGGNVFPAQGAFWGGGSERTHRNEGGSPQPRSRAGV